MFVNIYMIHSGPKLATGNKNKFEISESKLREKFSIDQIYTSKHNWSILHSTTYSYYPNDDSASTENSPAHTPKIEPSTKPAILHTTTTHQHIQPFTNQRSLHKPESPYSPTHTQSWSSTSYY